MLGQLSSTFSFFGRRNLLHDIRMQKPSARSIWEYDAYQTTKTEAPSLQITMKAPSITFLAASSESPTMLTSFHSTSYLAIRSIHGRTQSGMIIQNGQRTTEFLCVYIEYIHISVIYTHPTNVYTINLYIYTYICLHTQFICVSHRNKSLPTSCHVPTRSDFEPKVQAVIRRISLLQGLVGKTGGHPKSPTV